MFLLCIEGIVVMGICLHRFCLDINVRCDVFFTVGRGCSVERCLV